MRFLLPCALLLAAVPAHAGAQSFAAQFPARMLAAHNIERARARVAPLAWDNSLGAAAAAYAQQVAFSGRFQHSNRKARPGTGENLWMGARGLFSVESMVGAWASEKRWFRPGVFPNVAQRGSWQDVGHYTQMIWPTTTRVGCSVATTMHTDYLVCRYAGKGNIDGRTVGYALR